MPEEHEDNRPELEEEDGGGAVKSFLDHLEDLRWTIIKSGVAVLILMIVCLAAGNVVMKVLLHPLEQIYQLSSSKTPYVTLLVGSNRLATVDLGITNWNGLDLGTNKNSAWNLVPEQIGTNWVLTLVHNTNENVVPKTPVRLLNLSPAGGFIVAFHLAIYGGIALGSPFIIYYVAQFILPALKRKEKKYLYRGFFIGLGLFAMGVCFCYFVLTPLALRASQAYSHWLGIEAEQWTAEAYLSFVSKFLLGMGLGFELPVFLLIFVKLGLLDYKKLASFRRYMIVINLVLGAVLTTPEVLTQVMMAIPLQILYEITVWIAYYWEWKERKRQAAEEKSGND